MSCQGARRRLKVRVKARARVPVGYRLLLEGSKAIIRVRGIQHVMCALPLTEWTVSQTASVLV